MLNSRNCLTLLSGVYPTTGGLIPPAPDRCRSIGRLLAPTLLALVVSIVGAQQTYILRHKNRLVEKGILVSQNTGISTDSKKTGNYIEIDAERCKGCYLCITACPHDLIEKRDRLNQAGCHPACPKETALYKCTACGLCWQMCPDAAIEVFKAAKEAQA